MAADLLGGAMMMAGGSVLSVSSAALAHVAARIPAAAIGEALGRLYRPDTTPLPEDLGSLIEQLP